MIVSKISIELLDLPTKPQVETIPMLFTPPPEVAHLPPPPRARMDTARLYLPPGSENTLRALRCSQLQDSFFGCVD